MADISVDNPLVVEGSPDKTYDMVYISNLQIATNPGEAIVVTAMFRYYRLVDGVRDYAPISLGEQVLQISNLGAVFDQVEGGSDLKDAVESAFISLGKAYGVI